MTQVPMITIKKMQTRRTGKNLKEGVVSRMMMTKMIILKNKEMETTLIMMTKFSLEATLQMNLQKIWMKKETATQTQIMVKKLKRSNKFQLHLTAQTPFG